MAQTNTLRITEPKTRVRGDPPVKEEKFNAKCNRWLLVLQVRSQEARDRWRLEPATAAAGAATQSVPPAGQRWQRQCSSCHGTV